MFTDLHGHSKKMNCFIYGCAQRHGSSSGVGSSMEAIIPFLMDQISPAFRFQARPPAPGGVALWF